MSDQRHKVSIDLDFETKAGEARLSKMEAILDRLNQRAGALGGGGGGGPSGTTVTGSGLGGGAGSTAGPGGGPSPGTVSGSGGGASGGGPSAGGGPKPLTPAQQQRQEIQRASRAAAAGYTLSRGISTGASLATGYEQASTQVSVGTPFRLEGMKRAMPWEMAGSVAGGVGAMVGFKAGGMVGGVAGAAVGAVIGAVVSAVGQWESMRGNQRAAAAESVYATGGQVAGMHRTLSYARFSGPTVGPEGIGDLAARGARYGMGAEESVSTIGRWAQGARNVDPSLALRLSQTGVPYESLIGYHGLGSPGFGGRGGNVDRMTGLVQAQKLAPQQSATYLSTISGTASQMAQSGITMNLGQTEDLLGSMEGTRGLAGRGLTQARAVQGLMGGVAGARGALSSPFAGLGQSAALIRALKSGGGLVGAMKTLEGMGPGDERQAMIDTFGRGTVGTMGMAAMGMPTDFAADLAGPLGPAKFGATTTRGVSGVEQAKAEADNAVLVTTLNAVGGRLETAIKESGIALRESMERLLAMWNTP